MSRIIIIGYGGHSYMACDIIKHTRQEILGYFEQVEKTKNPFQIPYLGKENQQGSSDLLSQNEWFVAFDNNHFRKFITQKLVQRNVGTPCSLIHPTSLIGEGVAIGMGTMVAAGSIINILTTMGVSTIVNTNATVGYECKLADYVHIASGAVLANNVSIGERSFIGANAVIKEGIKIGAEVRVGAGSVVIRDIADGCTVVGNPGRITGKLD